MSSFLEFRHLAFRYPTDQGLTAIRAVVPEFPALPLTGGDGYHYLVFVEGGDNNVIEYRWRGRGRVARRWYFAAAGTVADVIRIATKVAEDEVEGGMVCLRTRARWTKPGTYVGTYRNALRRALPLERLGDALGAFHLPVGAAPVSETRERYAEHLVRAGRATLSGGTLQVSPAYPSTPDGMADWHFIATVDAEADRHVGWLGDPIAKVVLDRMASDDAMQRRIARIRRRAAA